MVNRLALVCVLILSSCTSGKKLSDEHELTKIFKEARLANTPASDWKDLDAWTSVSGKIDSTLFLEYSDNRIGGHDVHLRSYNGGLAGPTLRFNPGDVVRLNLVNKLPPNPSRHDADHNKPHDFNTTNLHTHGLHVSPSGSSDNVLLKIEPGEQLQFQFDIPQDHPPGTFWYHPHRHGSTAIQVASGLAGVMIVEGGIDNIPAIEAARERIFLFQQTPFYVRGDSVGRIADFDQIDFPRRGNGKYNNTTINGQEKPVLHMQPGEVERWRFIHGGVRELLDMQLVYTNSHKDIPLGLVAFDGISLGRMDSVRTLELAPGNRADVIVKAPSKEGTYFLLDLPKPPDEGLLGQEAPQYLAVIEVTDEGKEKDMALPTDDELSNYEPIVPIDTTKTPVVSRRTFDMSIVPGDSTKGTSTQFMMNGQVFDPEMEPVKLKLNTVEEWTLISAGAPTDHPFHVHVNPFLVTEINGEKIDPPRWQDTIMAPYRKEGDQTAGIKVLTRFEDFTGKFVMHCHILPHEDQGMMLLVEIED